MPSFCALIKKDAEDAGWLLGALGLTWDLLIPLLSAAGST